jgi:hypothetical protein
VEQTSTHLGLSTVETLGKCSSRGKAPEEPTSRAKALSRLREAFIYIPHTVGRGTPIWVSGKSLGWIPFKIPTLNTPQALYVTVNVATLNVTYTTKINRK